MSIKASQNDMKWRLVRTAQYAHVLPRGATVQWGAVGASKKRPSTPRP